MMLRVTASGVAASHPPLHGERLPRGGEVRVDVAPCNFWTGGLAALGEQQAG